MIATSIAVLFGVIAFATALTLIDCWLRAQSAFASLKRQQVLMTAGFVPQVEAHIVRLRPIAPRSASATRPYARRLPRQRFVPALDAA